MKLLGMQSLSCLFHSYSANSSKGKKKSWICHFIWNKQLLRENNKINGWTWDKDLLLVSYSPCNETQSENRTRWERVLCRCRMHSMPLYIAPIHFLFLSLTNYGNSSQGEETSSHLQTPPWLSIPKYPLVKCCGAVSCPCQFSCICFLVPGSSLV